MEYISLTYKWNGKQSIDLTIAVDQDKLVRVYDQTEELPLAARQLSGLASTAGSNQLHFIHEELRLVQPLLALGYLEERCCPHWLHPLYRHLQAQQRTVRYSTGYPAIDQLYQRYQDRAQYPIVKTILKLFSDREEDKLATVGFLDKLGPAAAIFINHKIQEPNERINAKVRNAQQRFAGSDAQYDAPDPLSLTATCGSGSL